MFFALAEHRHKMEKARAEGRAEGRKEGHAEGRQEGRQEGRAEGRKEGRADERATSAVMLDVLNAAARVTPDFLPVLLVEYQAWYRNRAADEPAHPRR